MIELLVVFYILAILAVAYLWLYPRFIGNNLKLMAWVDTVVTSVPLGISAILFWVSDPVFSLFGWQLNWFFYTLIAMLLIETPILILYLKARGLSREYWGYLKGSLTGQGYTAAAKAVRKELDDTSWDGLRTAGAKLFLVVFSNLVLILGSVFLFVIGDDVWASYVIIHILLVGVFWYLLRKAVRLVVDAPDEALDERLIALRNRSYLMAYRVLITLVMLALMALLIMVIVQDSAATSDGLSYALFFNWPQVQALTWLTIGYTAMLPSMTMLALELTSSRSRG